MFFDVAPRGSTCGPKQRTQKTQQILDIMQEEGRSTLREIASEVGVCHTTVRRVLRNDQNMSKITPKMVPRVLTKDQKRCRKQISQQNLLRIQEDPQLLDRLVTQDESWVFCYDPRTKQADMQWCSRDEQRPTKALRSRLTQKLMLIVFWDASGVIHHEFLEHGATVNTEIWLGYLRRFRESMRRKRPQLWTAKNWTFLMDNAPAHCSCISADFYHKTGMDLMSHPPYSPDLAPCDFWLFPTMKGKLRGMRFETLDDLQIAVSRTLKSIPKEEYRQALQCLPHRYQRCVDQDGGFFGKHKCKMPDFEHSFHLEAWSPTGSNPIQMEIHRWTLLLCI